MTPNPHAAWQGGPDVVKDPTWEWPKWIFRHFEVRFARILLQLAMQSQASFIILSTVSHLGWILKHCIRALQGSAA